MSKKMKTESQEKVLNWYSQEINKDKIELDKIKNDFIKDIKNIKKETIFKEVVTKKLTLWERIKKVLTGI
jgi:hypothetical protein